MAAPEPRPLLPHEARELLLARLSPLAAETVALTSALSGRVVAADVRAAHDLPPFDNSAMDGFAVRAADAGEELPIRGQSYAGDDPARLEPHTAMTIATGAPLPEGADSIVPIERARVDGDRVAFEGDVPLGDHVRRRGTDVAEGSVVVAAGGRLRPLALAAIATSGVAELSCHRRPRVAVVVTGDELVAPGEPLRHGQIHESNSILIAARCAQAGADVVAVERVPDDAGATREALARALEAADVVVTSGGVSVGSRDHVKPALAALGVEQLFWRLAVQPGRPTWCGLRDGRVVVGLPGNPLSVMVGLELVLAAGAAAARRGRGGRARHVPPAAHRRRCRRDAAARCACVPCASSRRAPSRSARTSRTSSAAPRSPMPSRSYRPATASCPPARPSI